MVKEEQIIKLLQTETSLSARDITDKLYGIEKHQSIVFGRLQKMQAKGIIRKDESSLPYRWALVSGIKSDNIPAAMPKQQTASDRPDVNITSIAKTVSHKASRKKTVALISCTSSKRGCDGYSCEARYLYDTSPFFPTSLAYAELVADEVFVISAEYHLVPLDKVIGWYNRTLNAFTAAEAKAWGKVVISQLSALYNLYETEFIVLAGENYYRPLIQNGLPEENVVRPLRGVDMYGWKAALRHLYVCARLHTLFNNMPRQHWNTINNINFVNGIYVLFECGEAYYNADRIVRVGTHRGDGRLRQRLKDHFIRENKDGSIFRKNVGKAILNKNHHPYLEVWSVNTSKSDNIARIGNRYDLALQNEIEKQVTDYMRTHFSFICFPVATEQQRLRFEEGIISALNLSKDFSASTNWHGQYNPEQEIAQSGLWLKQGLDGTPLSEDEYAYIEMACSSACD